MEGTTAAPWNTYFETLKRSLGGELDGAGQDEKTRAVKDLIRTSSAAAAVVALQPLPLVDTALLLPIQRRMVEGVARIRRSAPDQDTASAMFKTLRREFFAPHLSMAGAKLIPIVPFVGDVIAVSVAYALTSAIGELSDRVCREQSTMAPAEMRRTFNTLYRDTFERTYKHRRNELIAAFRRNPEVRRKLDELRQMRRDGTLDEEKAERRLDDILKGRTDR